MDVFSLILESAISWGVGRMLDTVAGCGNCGHRHDASVENESTGLIICPRCSGRLDQYTNATDHTVQANGAIAAAQTSGIHWDSWGGFWDSPFNPHFRVDCVNSKYQDLVARLILSEFQGEEFQSTDIILRPNAERNYWDDLWWKVPKNNFPIGSGTFALDVFLFNTWGDELHRARSLGQWTRSESS